MKKVGNGERSYVDYFQSDKATSCVIEVEDAAIGARHPNEVGAVLGEANEAIALLLAGA